MDIAQQFLNQYSFRVLVKVFRYVVDVERLLSSILSKASEWSPKNIAAP